MGGTVVEGSEDEAMEDASQPNSGRPKHANTQSVALFVFLVIATAGIHGHGTLAVGAPHTRT